MKRNTYLTPTLQQDNQKMSIWQRTIAAIKAFDEAMDHNPLEQAVIINQKRIAALEEKFAELESETRHQQGATRS